ncbi:MAG TPA: RND transporter [Paenibacillaceae bacterium]|nr:RND transporter [Paenibacillaceae bacterium]
MALAKQKKGKKGLVIGIIAGVIIIGLIATQILLPKQNKYTDVTVKKATIETYYTFSGSVDSKYKQNVMASNVMQISEINVNEGEKVEKDTVLFTTSQGNEIKSQIVGTISKIYVEQDQQVMSGTQLCDIYDFDNLQISVKVDEHDLNGIAKGKTVSVSIDALNKEMTGSVSSISSTAINENGIAYFSAVIDLPKDNSIKVGMTAEAKILNKQAKDVLSIPVKALQFDTDDKPYVLIKQEKGAPVKKYVKVGINDGKTVEITEGLKEGQVVSYIPIESNSNNNRNNGRMGGMVSPGRMNR